MKGVLRSWKTRLGLVSLHERSNAPVSLVPSKLSHHCCQGATCNYRRERFVFLVFFAASSFPSTRWTMTRECALCDKLKTWLAAPATSAREKDSAMQQRKWQLFIVSLQIHIRFHSSCYLILIFFLHMVLKTCCQFWDTIDEWGRYHTASWQMRRKFRYSVGSLSAHYVIILFVAAKLFRFRR